MANTGKPDARGVPVTVDREQFNAVLGKLIAAPPLPKSEIAPKRARKDRKAVPAKAPKK
jgi:hypothetical protein